MENLALAEQPAITDAADPAAVFRRAHLRLVPDIVPEPEASSVQDAEWETEAQARFKSWMGSLVLRESVDSTQPNIEAEPDNTNILERLQAAKAGSKEALDSVTINVATAINEVVFKEDHVGATYMDRNPDGEPVQFGQTNDSIYKNGFNFRPDRHSILEKITQVEALNRHRIEAALKADELKDHHFVVFSLVPNGVPEKDLGPEGDGYFVDSLSLNIQDTTEVSDGRVKTETGFMAGVEADENDTFEDRLAKRHDFSAVAKVYEWLGLDPPATAEEALDRGILIPKAMMPNGVVDVMRWFAEATDAVKSRNIERKAEDFIALKFKSKQREASLKDVRHKVLEDLLDATDDLATPEEAVKLIWSLIARHATNDAFTNPNIDPKVFGKEAASHIVMARQYSRGGRLDLAYSFMQKAHDTAVVTGCGGGGSSSKKTSEGSSDDSSEDGVEGSAGRDRFGSRKFVCSNGHTNIRPHNKLIPKCQHSGCEAKVACK